MWLYNVYYNCVTYSVSFSQLQLYIPQLYLIVVTLFLIIATSSQLELYISQMQLHFHFKCDLVQCWDNCAFYLS